MSEDEMKKFFDNFDPVDHYLTVTGFSLHSLTTAVISGAEKNLMEAAAKHICSRGSACKVRQLLLTSFICQMYALKELLQHKKQLLKSLNLPDLKELLKEGRLIFDQNANNIQYIIQDIQEKLDLDFEDGCDK